MTRLLAIDPGPLKSAFVLYDTVTRMPLSWCKTGNDDLLNIIWHYGDELVIEMIASYGMAVGVEVFETCLWIGRFIERRHMSHPSQHPLRIFRREVKLHLCGNSRAKDANIRQSLVDRYGGKEQAIGRKASPGPLYGLTGDCWSALAVAVTAAEMEAA